jgi:predicted restriction endonuclease
MSNSKKETRRKFRDAVFARDNYKCAVCGVGGELDAHHITDRNAIPNGGYVVENGISLCPRCHELAEDFHRGKTCQQGFHPDELYATIGSDRASAESASSRKV